MATVFPSVQAVTFKSKYKLCAVTHQLIITLKSLKFGQTITHRQQGKGHSDRNSQSNHSISLLLGEYYLVVN